MFFQVTEIAENFVKHAFPFSDSGSVFASEFVIMPVSSAHDVNFPIP